MLHAIVLPLSLSRLRDATLTLALASTWLPCLLLLYTALTIDIVPEDARGAHFQNA